MFIDLQSILERSDVPADVKATIGQHLEHETRQVGDQALFRALGAFLRAGLLVEDEQGCISYINERLTQLTGLRAGDLEGRRLQSILHGSENDIPPPSWDKAGRPVESMLIGGDGGKIPATLIPFPLFDHEGRYHGRFTIVTERSSTPRPPLQTTQRPPHPSPAEKNYLTLLSPREREILNELLAGQRVNDIASKLDISRHTVRNHLKAIYRKVGVHSQVELIGRAWPSGVKNDER
ncbi:MAG: PAS and helix-turn-helix domain-containing protein [Deltaproteobacteria bacterium]|nr:PAS and helix-turn-helix domain-containing protein [Deltaproteobacteria bacterium]